MASHSIIVCVWFFKSLLVVHKIMVDLTITGVLESQEVDLSSDRSMLRGCTELSGNGVGGHITLHVSPGPSS